MSPLLERNSGGSRSPELCVILNSKAQSGEEAWERLTGIEKMTGEQKLRPESHCQNS